MKTNKLIRINIIFLLSTLLSFLVFTNFVTTGISRPTGQISGEERGTLTSLPWSHFELGRISDKISGDVYYGEAASESAFKKATGRQGIIHIATHAFIDNESPSYSRLMFNNGGEPGEDGILYAYEIYNLQLNSELAVLSSCNTGTGKLIKGEGIFSLARAFMYAGVPSVIVSLWDIDDRSTAEVVVGFYKRLEAGESKADALRNVKLDYLRKSDQLTANPIYWAGLVSIGDQGSVKVASKSNLYRELTVTALILLVFFIIIKRKIKRQVRG
jgi:CHAT domain-containing protein